MKAENIAGSDETSCNACVKDSPNVDEQQYIVDPEKYLKKRGPSIDEQEKEEIFNPPKIIEPLANFKVYEGDDHRLVCKVDGYPKPKVFD